MHLEEFDSLRAYVGFHADGERQLARLIEHTRPRAPELADDFYDAILNNEQAAAVITGGNEQVQRLKQTLIDWLNSLLSGPWDEKYMIRHARIGRMHVKINLPQEFMFTAMSRMRGGVVRIASEHMTADELEPTIQAINQVFDLELALMLDTYRSDWAERIRSTERLATVGHLATSVGHELRDPLGVMASSLFLLERRCDALGVVDDVVQKHITRIGNQIENSGNTITSLLELARNVPPNPHLVRATDLVGQALDKVAAGSEVHVHNCIPETLELYGDEAQIVRVLTNLLENALQAIQKKGNIHIEGRREGDGVALIVRDDGPGVAPQIADRIFEVLFTTGPNRSGLGLALCAKIATAHRGRVSLADSQNGAAFLLWLPDAGSPFQNGSTSP